MPDRTDLATFASTNVNASDADVLIKDDANPLKIFKFQASGLPEGTTTIDVSTLGTVAGLLDDRGNYNASVNTFPASGGSGTAGAILKGDTWFVSVAGTLGGVAVGVGDMLRALVDTPAQTASNWSVLEANLGYVPAASGANSDITSLAGLTTPLSEAQGGNGNAFGNTIPHTRYNKKSTDCEIIVAPPPWTLAAVLSGTIGYGTVDANHTGIFTLNSSTSANSGYYLTTGTGAYLLAGGEVSTHIFKTTAVIDAGNKLRLGFNDSLTVTEPVDGMYIDITGSTLRGDCRRNSVESVTGTTYTLAAATWYRGEVSLNAAGTLATFTVYNMAGTVLWTDTVASNIPTDAGRVLGHGIIALNTGTVAVTILELDYMSIEINRTLGR